MPERSPVHKPPPPADRMTREVASKQRGAERGHRKWNWSSIAILGVVGWSVAVPTLGGLALGIWMDSRWPSSFSWSLAFLVGGLVCGCVIAWLRVKGDAS